MPLPLLTPSGLAHAIAACRAFVDENPANGIVVGALHLVLRQVASLLLLGTREHLAASAAAASRSELCVDVVAALEVSRGGVRFPAIKFCSAASRVRVRSALSERC